jgi:SAM-dependent methyltransferase
VLLLDFKDDDLAGRLSSMGIEVCNANYFDNNRTIFNNKKFDFIVAGQFFEYLKTKKMFYNNISKLLKDGGFLVSIIYNSYGYSRIRKTASFRSSRTPYKNGGSLRKGLKGLRDLGFKESRIFAPIPNILNPTAFISLEESNSLQFLLSHFPDFRMKKSFLVENITKLLINSNCYRYFLNQYVIVSRMY